MELRDRLVDLCEVHVRVIRFQLLDDSQPFFIGLAVLLRLRVLPLQHLRVLLCLAQQLHGVSLGVCVPSHDLLADIQLLDPLLNFKDEVLPCTLVLLDLVDILVIELLRQHIAARDLPHHVREVSFRRLRVVAPAGPLVSPLVKLRRVQIRVHLVKHPLLVLHAPCPQCQHPRVIRRFRLIDVQNALAVFHLPHGFLADISAQQRADDLLVFRRQQVLVHNILHTPTELLDLLAEFQRFFCRLRDRQPQQVLRLLLPVEIPLRDPQICGKFLDRIPRVIFRPVQPRIRRSGLEHILLDLADLCRVHALVALDPFARLPDPFGDLVDLHDLCARRFVARREQLRRLLVERPVNVTHRHPVVPDLHALRRLLPELIPVSDILFVLRWDGDFLILDELEDPLVLLVVRLVFLHADLHRRVDQIAHQLIVQLAGLQKLPHDLLRERLQRLPLRLRRNAEAPRDLRQQEVFRPPGVLRRLLPHHIPIPPVLRRIPDIRVR